MYSANWFSTFAGDSAQRATSADVAGILAACPHPEFTTVLDVGCGTGRVAGPLAAHGYRVYGIDTNVAALTVARQRAPRPTYIALEQAHAGAMRWTVDAALILWNSLGYVDRAADLATLRSVAHVLRPGGRLVLDLYHPEWLRGQPSQPTQPRPGVSVRRWVESNRCINEIRYADESTDRIAFNVYMPDEARALMYEAGITAATEMVWWDPSQSASSAHARYQIIGVRT